jgi:hypothetical protein
MLSVSRVGCAAPSESASQADALLAQFMAVENDGSLAQRVRKVVAKAGGIPL